MKKIMIYLIIILMVLTLFGCGAGDAVDPADEQGGHTQEDQVAEEPPQGETGGEQATADIIEPEQIVTLQEAIEIMGRKLVIGDKTYNETVGQKICSYEAADPEDFTMFQVSVLQLAFLPPEQVEYGNTPENIFKVTKDNFDETLEPVEGIGNDAFIDTPGFHLLYRGYYVVIALGNSDEPANIEKLKTAGQKAIANLDIILR